MWVTRLVALIMLALVAGCGSGSPSFDKLSPAVDAGIKTACTQDELGDRGEDLKGHLAKVEVVAQPGSCLVSYFTGPSAAKFKEGGRVASVYVVVHKTAEQTPRTFKAVREIARKKGDDLARARELDYDGWTYGLAAPEHGISHELTAAGFSGMYYVLVKVTDKTELGCAVVDAATKKGDLVGEEAAVAACNEIVSVIAG